MAGGHTQKEGIDAMGGTHYSFNPVIVALFSIALMCGIYIGFNQGAIPAVAAGLGFFIWGACPHFGCLIASYRQGKTKACVVLMIFTGFWTVLGIGLMAGLMNELGPLLLYSEPVIAASILIMAYYYVAEWDSCPLGLILIGLGVAVAILWLSKLFHWPPLVGSITVGLLGLGVFWTAIDQLNCE